MPVKEIFEQRQIQPFPGLVKHPSEAFLHNGDLVPLKVQSHKGALGGIGEFVNLSKVLMDRVGKQLLDVTPVEGVFIQVSPQFFESGLLF